MKILITGAAGMLAADVIKVLSRSGHEIIKTDINQRLPDIERLDITNLEEVLRKTENVKPDYIFHFAAETDVDLCQKNPEHAFRVNALGTKNMVLAAKEYGSRFLYISTGNVFDGRKLTAYVESDEAKPINKYGQSKLQGEEEVKKLLSEYFIIRVGWMVGGWELDKKFVYKIVQQLKRGKKGLKVVSDKFGSPTFTEDFADNFMPLLETERFGLYHMANKGTCSRYDIAVKVVEYMGFKDKVKIEPIGSSQFPLPAPRPNSEMLDNRKLDLFKLNNMPYWQDSLKKYIHANKAK